MWTFEGRKLVKFWLICVLQKSTNVTKTVSWPENSKYQDSANLRTPLFLLRLMNHEKIWRGGALYIRPYIWICWDFLNHFLAKLRGSIAQKKKKTFCLSIFWPYWPTTIFTKVGTEIKELGVLCMSITPFFNLYQIVANVLPFLK